MGIRRAVSAVRSRRSLLGSEQGSLLVEVMVGAVVLAIATGAILSGLDGSQATGQRNKDRSLSATLAQQDIERLRALPITQLSNRDETNIVTVQNVRFTVVSKTDWVRDSSGLVSCTDDNTQAEYLKVASTVHSPASEDYPVEETTLLTPAPGAFGANTGTAAVLVTDRDGNPLAGVGVGLTGPSSVTETTNELGCAIFGYITAGDYTATASGGVSWNGESPPTAPVTVNAGRTSLTQIEIDDPASLRGTFVRPVSSPVTVTPRATHLGVTHAKLENDKIFIPTPPGLTTSIVAGNLFPHRDGYGVYAGSCETNDPSFWNVNYFQPLLPGYVELDPGASDTPVNVLMPTLRVRVQRPASGTGSGTGSWVGRVYVWQADHSSYVPSLPPDIDCRDAAYGSPSTITNSSTTKTFDFVVPFGNYRVCANLEVAGSRRRATSGIVDLTTATPGHRQVDLVLPTSGNTTCS